MYSRILLANDHITQSLKNQGNSTEDMNFLLLESKFTLVYHSLAQRIQPKTAQHFSCKAHQKPMTCIL